MNAPLRVAVTLGSLLLLGLVLLHETERTSPGELWPAHQQEPGLARGKGCEACHGDGTRAGLARACLECHDDLREQLAASRGWHATLPGAVREACGACHVEHHGDSLPLVTAASFARGGVAKVSAYRHQGLAWKLSGRHLTLDCVACHVHAQAAVLAAGEKRYLGLSQACASCHKDPHEGRLGSECASCHGEEQPWAQVAAVVHDPRFPLTLGHAGRECRACHREGSHSLEELGQRSPADPTPVRACAACHADPHAPDLVPRTAISLQQSADCARCHATDRFAGVSFGVEEHQRIGVELAGAHARADCAACHGSARPQTAPVRAGARREMAACVQCHPDPHQPIHAGGIGQALPLRSTADCAACHGLETFTGVTFGVAEHARLGVLLLGAHASAACAGCHGRPGERPRQFRKLAMQLCADCHRSSHTQAFLGEERDCAACHDGGTARFDDRTPERTRAAHAAIGFPLQPAHDRVACTGCHQQPAPAAPLRIHVPARNGNDCAACHADPHRGQFDGGPFAKSTCVACHLRTAFVPSNFTVEQHEQSRFPLRAAHGAVACVHCHEVHDGVRRFRGTKQDCASCHADPHAGQFQSGGRTDCASCHQDGTSFRKVLFNHDRQSRFPLDKTHGSLECAKCHRPKRHPDGRVRVHYKPLGTQCGDCHLPGGRR
jgi:hypothetical protein